MKLTMKEEQKVNVLQSLLNGSISMNEACILIERSHRTVYRLLSRVEQEGIRGVIHKNRDRKSPKKIPVELECRILELVNSELSDINDTHLKELLFEREEIKIGRETLRRLLRSNGIKPKRRRRSKKYRRRRERKESFGMMLQIDASVHDWLEGRGPRITLVGVIDDATGRVWALFVESESTWAYLELMRKVFRSNGVPLSLYSDRHTIFHSTREPTVIEQLQALRPLTQFGRAMEEMGVAIIKAWSPQAKGRIERLWGTFQDRLIVEMRLAEINDLNQANKFLVGYLRKHNKQFSVKAKSPVSFFRKAPKAKELDTVLCIKETRTVSNDHTISFEGLALQIPPSRKYASIAKQKVQVLQLRNKSLAIQYKGKIIVRFSHEAVARLIVQKHKENSDLKAA